MNLITTNAALDALIAEAQGKTIVLKAGRTVIVGQPTRTGGYHWTTVAYDEDEGRGYAEVDTEKALRGNLDWIAGHGVTVLA